MLSNCIESAVARFRAPGAVGVSMGRTWSMSTSAKTAYGMQHKQLPTADARAAARGVQCAWSPPV